MEPAPEVEEALVEGEVLDGSVAVELAPLVPVPLGDVALEAPAPVAVLAPELVFVAEPDEVPAALDCSGVLPAPAPDCPPAAPWPIAETDKAVTAATVRSCALSCFIVPFASRATSSADIGLRPALGMRGTNERTPGDTGAG